MNCGVGSRRGSDLVLLWLWHRLMVTAPIESLAWESPYAVGVALERPKYKKKKDLWEKNKIEKDPAMNLYLFSVH